MNYRVGWRMARTIFELDMVEPYCSQCKSYLRNREIDIASLKERKMIKKMKEEQKQRDRTLLAKENAQISLVSTLQKYAESCEEAKQRKEQCARMDEELNIRYQQLQTAMYSCIRCRAVNIMGHQCSCGN